MSRKRRHEDASEDDVLVYNEHSDISPFPSLCPRSLRIDSSVKKIPPRTFMERISLNTVEYEEGLEVIGENAFSYCFSLQEQQFPSTLVEIGKYAFGGCTRLKSVGHLPPSLKIIRENAFKGCERMERFEIPHDAIRLEDGVFRSCFNLTQFKLPQGMVTIPSRLFEQCYGLVDVNVPSSVINIGSRAFEGCEQLDLIELPTGLKTIGHSAFYRTGLTQFHCPVTVESIGHSALAFCDSLESVILPPKLEVISERTFDHCRNLKDVMIPQSVGQCNALDLSRLNLTSIGKFAFAGCGSLLDVILPKTNLKRIEERCFEGCYSLSHLWVPPSVEYIDNGAFAGCISLFSVEVPETLKRIVFIGYQGEGDEDEGFRSELCGYESLVNIYIPPSHQLDGTSRDDFMEEMKLGEAEGNYPELVAKLKRRFNDLPLHRACYFQSYHPLQENIRRIRSIIRADGTRACERVDFLGMTPFHILALSHRPLLNLFQELLSVSSVDIMKCRDVFGSTPLDYLCKNDSSSAVSLTKSLLLTITEPRVLLLGLDSWRDDVMFGLEKIQVANEIFLSIKVTSVCQKLARYERMEALSLLEMSIWRMKMEEGEAIGSDARESCRINCGSSIVLEHVIPFLRANDLSEDVIGRQW